MELSGATCLVTGAASGIGAAIVDALTAAGASVVGVDLDPPPTGRAESGVHWARADVSKPDELRASFAVATELNGSLDVVVNNAAIIGAWPEQSPESIATIAAVNLGGVMMGTRLALDAMSARGGVVINTASKTGLIPEPASAAYAGTKAGIIHFTLCCADLLESRGVRVNAVLPGLTDTAMFAGATTAVTPRAPHRQPLAPTDVARVFLEVVADDTMTPGSYRLADRDAIAGQPSL